VPSIFILAYYKCASVDKANSGFLSTGIYPYNPDIFTGDEYAPSLVTENADPTLSTAAVLQ
jgi:hypothetical protein